jgi:hypothetical protein
VTTKGILKYKEAKFDYYFSGLDSKNNIEKQTKISFEYAPYSMLKQLNLNWSTATLNNPKTYGKIIQNLTDKDRSLPVGTALQNLIQYSYETMYKIVK